MAAFCSAGADGRVIVAGFALHVMAGVLVGGGDGNDARGAKVDADARGDSGDAATAFEEGRNIARQRHHTAEH